MIEKILTYQDFEAAPGIFSTGNYSKVVPVTGIDGTFLHPGPIHSKARGTVLIVRAFGITSACVIENRGFATDSKH